MRKDLTDYLQERLRGNQKRKNSRTAGAAGSKGKRQKKERKNSPTRNKSKPPTPPSTDKRPQRHPSELYHPGLQTPQPQRQPPQRGNIPFHLGEPNRSLLVINLAIFFLLIRLHIQILRLLRLVLILCLRKLLRRLISRVYTGSIPSDSKTLADQQVP